MNEQAPDVVIVGAGPVGLTLANLLGVYGVRTLVIERNDGLEPEPRAVTLDDESLRTFQNAGLLAPVLENVVLGYGVQYYDWRGKPFAAIRPTGEEYGFPKRNAFRQPMLVRTLYEGLDRFAHVEVRFGHTFTSFVQDGEGILIEVQAGAGTHSIPAKWLVACDGGRSPVREFCHIRLDGETYAERWLIVDLAQRSTALRHTRTYCDPRRPAIRLPGPHGSLRYEFMLRPEDKDDEVLDEANFRRWVAARVPEDRDLPLVRKVIYGFHARVATRWREGRVFFAGDAAHLTPPFAGQGLNSGVRDAANLSWKLAAVLGGHLPVSLLDTYEQERRPHATALIGMALRIGKVMQPKTIVGAAITQTALRAACLIPACRDYILQLKFKPKPRFHGGFFEASPGLTSTELAPQPKVELARQERRLDDLLGSGFCIIGRDAQALARAEPGLAPGGMPAQRVAVIPSDDDFLGDAEAGVLRVRDASGLLTGFLDRLDASAVVLRPDRYVYRVYPRDASLIH